MNNKQMRALLDDKHERMASVNQEAIDVEARTVALAFSSNEPYERMYGLEILSHELGHVNLERLENKGAVLVDHNHTDQVGVIEKVWVDENRTGRARVRFGRSDRASDIFNDIVDGIRTHVSVGYFINELELTRQVDGGPNEYTATNWQPFEISMVSVPADTTVGVGRSFEEKEVEVVAEIAVEPEPEIIEPEMAREVEIKMSEDVKINIEDVKADARKAELHRVREIAAIGDKVGMANEARQFINDGKTIEDFRTVALDAIASKPVTVESEIGMTEKEQRSYSMLKAVNAVVSGSWAGAELEKEASDAVAKNLGKRAQGFYLPRDIQKRDMLVSGTGSNAVGTDNLGGNFIDLMRNALKVKELGATVMGGLVGNVAIPSLATGSASYWVTEGAAPTEATPALSQVTLSPSTVAAYVDLGRTFLNQSSLDAEAMFIQDLALSLATKIDLAAINGSGSGSEPTGILNTTGIGAVDFTTEGAPSYEEIVDVWEEVAKDNGLVGNPAFLTNATLAGKLMATDSFSSAGLPILADGKVMGYDCAISEQVPAHHIIFGNWSDLVIGEWGAIDIKVDEYSLSTSGSVRVVALHDVDIALRHAASFGHGD